ncbi:MAG: hypothetical protein K2L81_02015 [Muribaculaceae bacterium]|nr:hypothetical protein [Muribaculaceae bacterium]
MKINWFSLLTVVIVAASLSSCASIATKSHQDVTFKGLPGTTVIDKKNNTTIAEIGQNGFSNVKMKKQLKGKNLLIVKDGYQSENRNMGTKIQGAFWCNLLFGGIPGFAIDAATGKMMKFKDNFVDVTLSRKIKPTEAPAPEPTPQPVERVDRNHAGQTDMEKAILRWYFDSDPRGARVFFRVISSVPDEVKNTNETYLTTTPIEETRGFNIPGLTYENSRDVTIEIKVTKRGYEEQVKRYNVRQAIDQQEISGFFELVPKN